MHYVWELISVALSLSLNLMPSKQTMVFVWSDISQLLGCLYTLEMVARYRIWSTESEIESLILTI